MRLTIPNEPINPVEDEFSTYNGLTKREYIAIMCLQGKIAGANSSTMATDAVQSAVLYADLLIEELNK